ncbi:MAG: DNA repair protein RecN [Deferribacterales bacterium]
MYLSYLSVQNFSVIDDVEMEFSKGLNIFTGETGAGKTLIVNAIKLLLGDKLSKNYFRDETKPIRVQGVFAGDFSMIPQELKEDFEIDDEVIIKREVDVNGKNRVTINGQVVPIKIVQALTESFVDIHGQHEHQLLLNPKNHLGFIDAMVEEELKSDYFKGYQKLVELDRNIKKIEENLEGLKRERDYIEFQIAEISSLNLDVEKDNGLEDRIEILSNMDKIRQHLTNVINMLSGDEINVELLLNNIAKEFSAIARFGDEFKKLAEKLDSIIYEFEDVSRTSESILSKYDIDEDELNRLIERKESITRVCKKYGKKLAELPEYLEELNNRYNDIECTDQKLDGLKREKETVLAELFLKKNRLNLRRREIAEVLADKITEILKDLELKNAKFIVKIDETDNFDAKGGFLLEFYISTNVGFEPGPLSKIASGGEISRVMLALKEAFSQVDSVGTLIFDEIDTGISGVTAKKVAEKLKLISENKQVIVITHLPVVASKGDKHFHLIKKESDGKSKTVVQELGTHDRIKVLASMISGEITELTLNQAKELLGR